MNPEITEAPIDLPAPAANGGPKDGVYRIYHRFDHEQHGPQRRLHSRFLIHGGAIHHLEDHFGHLDDMRPEGALDNRHKRQLAHLLRSHAFEVINEDDVQAGEHDNEIPDFDPGLTLADSYFFLVSPDSITPKKVEVQGDTVIVDGAKLTDEQAELLIYQIQTGRAKVHEVAEQGMAKSEEDDTYYHGTQHDFDRFEQRAGVGGLGGPFHNPDNPIMTQRTGFFFTKNPRVAEGYAGDSGRVIHAKLNSRSPYNFTDRNSFYDPELDEAFTKEGLPSGFLSRFSPESAYKWPTWQMFDGENGPKVVSALTNLGYDGAVFHEPSPDDEDTDETHVVFNPDQIQQTKSVRNGR